MNSDSDRIDSVDLPPEIRELLESTLREAGSYVVPSESLRANTLSAANVIWNSGRRNRLFYRVLVIMGCFMAISLHAIQAISYMRESINFTPEERLQQEAQELADDRNIGPDWAISESYRRYREEQSRQIQSILFNDAPSTTHSQTGSAPAPTTTGN